MEPNAAAGTGPSEQNPGVDPGSTTVTVAVVAPGDTSDTGPDPAVTAERARSVLERALAPELRDDRFDPPWPPADLVAAIEMTGPAATGYLGGSVADDIVVHGLLVDADPDDPIPAVERAERLLRALQPHLAPGRAIQFWAHPAEPWHQALAERHGWQPHRSLHQLRCLLPVAVDRDPLPTRPFVPGRDEAALIRVNNRAFADHPDQGGMTRERLARAAAQPWFDPDGIRLHDDPERPGELAGFCWTKIHPPLSDGQPPLGEIYAIGVDPDHHGRGLGVPMTAAGLDWLADQGLTTGMLYVEADNDPAVRTYERLGFRHHRTDRAWRGTLR